MLALVGALLGAWPLIYVAAMMLLIGLSLTDLLTVWLYIDVEAELRRFRHNGATIIEK